jgi:hypothetical protein
MLVSALVVGSLAWIPPVHTLVNPSQGSGPDILVSQYMSNDVVTIGPGWSVVIAPRLNYSVGTSAEHLECAGPLFVDQPRDMGMALTVRDPIAVLTTGNWTRTGAAYMSGQGFTLHAAAIVVSDTLLDCQTTDVDIAWRKTTQTVGIAVLEFVAMWGGSRVPNGLLSCSRRDMTISTHVMQDFRPWADEVAAKCTRVSEVLTDDTHVQMCIRNMALVGIVIGGTALGLILVAGVSMTAWWCRQGKDLNRWPPSRV